MIQELADPSLALLNFTELFKTANALHDYIATAADEGASIITTNFDSLMERSILARGSSPSTIASSSEFAAAIEGIPPGFIPVFKLHGSWLSHQGDQVRSSPETVQATLDSISAGWTGFLLPETKRRVLESIAGGRTLIVAGYSASDDFDVVPTLRRMVPKSVLWILHDE